MVEYDSFDVQSGHNIPSLKCLWYFVGTKREKPIAEDLNSYIDLTDIGTLEASNGVSEKRCL